MRSQADTRKPASVGPELSRGKCLKERLPDRPEKSVHAARSAALLPFGNSAKPALSHPAHRSTRRNFAAALC